MSEKFVISLSRSVWKDHYDRLGECVARAEGGYIREIRIGKTTAKVELNFRSLDCLLADLTDYANPTYWDEKSERSWSPYRRALASVRKQVGETVVC